MAGELVAAIIVVQTGIALDRAVADRGAAEAIGDADAIPTRNAIGVAAEQGVIAAGVLGAGMAGAVAERLGRISAVADMVVAALAFAAVAVDHAGFARIGEAMAGRIADSGHRRDAGASRAWFLADVAAEFGAATAGAGIADLAWAANVRPGGILAGADTAHAGAETAVSIACAFIARIGIADHLATGHA